MDSVSQFVLGAAIGHVVAPQLGRKALLIGGFTATLPDLDVLVQYSDAVDSFTYHRSWSHSIFVLSAISPLVAIVINKLAPNIPYRRCLLLVWLCLFTHPILDGFTIYGTQIFWPLPLPPVAIGSIFIIDPLYTVPLIVAAVLVWRRRLQRPSRAIAIALFISSMYIGWTVLAQHHARQVAQASLQAQGKHNVALLVAPSPLSLLWRYVVLEGPVYYEGYYSLLDHVTGPAEAVTFYPIERGLAVLDDANHIPAVSRMRWFTNDFVAAKIDNNSLVLSDLRMGLEGSYVFEFVVAENKSNSWQAITSILMPIKMDGERIRMVLQRVVDPMVNLAP